jgi:hypothetical protein
MIKRSLPAALALLIAAALLGAHAIAVKNGPRAEVPGQAPAGWGH